MGELDFTSIVGADVVAKNVVVTGASACTEEGDAVSGRVVTVIVLNDVVVIVVIDVEVAAVAVPTVIRIGLIELDGAGMAIPLPQADGRAPGAFGANAAAVDDIFLKQAVGEFRDEDAVAGNVVRD